jgi:hypothetical protein
VSKKWGALQFAWDLQYAIHEVPNEVLYGREAASAEQCILLNQELTEFYRLIKLHGLEERYAHLVEECQYHFTSYPMYLFSRDKFDSYEQFLEYQENANSVNDRSSSR